MIILDANNWIDIAQIFAAIFVLFFLAYSICAGIARRISSSTGLPIFSFPPAPPKQIKPTSPWIGNRKRFGKNDDFLAVWEDGFLCVICWGGTAFAKKCESLESAKALLTPLENYPEEGVQYYCKADKWYFFDYYKYQIVDITNRDSKIIHTFNYDLTIEK